MRIEDRDRAVRIGDPGYPERLRDLSHPPDPAFLSGPWDHDGLVVAIVGSRGAQDDGLEMARCLAGDLAREGVAIVSGLAEGIDAAAHQGALLAGGRTAAVLGTPLDRTYPRRPGQLQRRVAESLGLMSEIPPGAHATRGTFSTRNRLIAALAHAVILVQGGEGSGALRTVEAAEALGRPVGAVPWHADEPLAAAPHALIRARRAVLVRHAEDVLDLLERTPSPALVAARAARAIGRRRGAAADEAGEAAAGTVEPEGAHQRRVLAGLGRRAQPLDVVAARASLSAAETSAALLSLELAGVARREPGGRFRLARTP